MVAPDKLPIVIFSSTVRTLSGQPQQLADSFSQFTAYIYSIRNFAQNKALLCTHMGIAEETLDSRMTRAAEVRMAQNSLFDRKARVSKRFRPAAGRPGTPAGANVAMDNGQFAWNF